jgi:small subunit ribosomal protein S20
VVDTRRGSAVKDAPPLDCKETDVANIKSAEKRNRQRIRRRARNVAHMSKVRTSVKKVVSALTHKEVPSPEALAIAIKTLDKAAQRGVMNKKTASRKISRLTKATTHATKNPVVHVAKPVKAKAARKAKAKK